MSRLRSIEQSPESQRNPIDNGPVSGIFQGPGLPSNAVMSTLVGQSTPMMDLGRSIERVIRSDITVAILGETGTGKELVARTIHAAGPRRNKPFVAINCAAIAESLQDSELFGHERGSFTGAHAQRRGCFEQANGGTLFLDELGEMSASTQARLLRTLQERAIRRVGGTEDISIDVRVICATRRNLKTEMAEGRFREDLYYRLVVYPIELPPLRERRDDLPMLVSALIEKVAAEAGSKAPRVHPEALKALARYEWPGNVRELLNVVQRSMLLCQDGEITLADLPSFLARKVARAKPAPQSDAPGDQVAIRDVERSAIDQALASANGHVGNAAKLLGISRATLYRRLGDRSKQETA
ncbi:MAG: sigma-54 dependent transcriptional regulator [Byssovorax sp.]